MKHIDSVPVSFYITPTEIIGAGEDTTCNPEAFVAFMEGLVFSDEDLLDERIASLVNGRGAMFGSDTIFFQTFMHFVLPKHYDVNYMSKNGGRFTLRITGVSDYTVSIFLGRLVVFNGAQPDQASGKKEFDTEVRADIFLATLNNIFANLCLRVFEKLDPVSANQ